MTKPTILFPSDPLSPWKVDDAFLSELEAAQVAKLTTGLVNVEAVLKDEIEEALIRAPKEAGLTVYRGWMLKPRQYSAVYEALVDRGTQLINTLEQYRTCHYLPYSYPFILEHTPKTVWFKSLDHLDEALDTFGESPVIVKDYVKSQKHYWAEACFIPRASDRDTAHKVVNRFLQLQGDDLNEGIVLRQYVPLKILGQHPKSGTPLAAEFRIFWLDGRPIMADPYWGKLTTHDVQLLPLVDLTSIARQVPSLFFSMDVAFLEDGSWTIVELGDGQVSGLPDDANAIDFYLRLAG